jgi:hypothetical protein
LSEKVRKKTRKAPSQVDKLSFGIQLLYQNSSLSSFDKDYRRNSG